MPDSASEISVEVDLPRGRVLNRHVATDQTEISVNLGDVVCIVQTLEDGLFFVGLSVGRGVMLMCFGWAGWTEVQLGTRCGLCPTKFIQREDSEESAA